MGQFLRIVIILVAVWLVLQIIKRALLSHQKPPASRPVAHMVACAHCGMHVPEPQAIRDNGRAYCSEEHRRVASNRRKNSD